MNCKLSAERFSAFSVVVLQSGLNGSLWKKSSFVMLKFREVGELQGSGDWLRIFLLFGKEFSISVRKFIL